MLLGTLSGFLYLPCSDESLLTVDLHRILFFIIFII